MEITIKGSPEDITKLLQTIASSQEQKESTNVLIDRKAIAQGIHIAIRDRLPKDQSTKS